MKFVNIRIAGKTYTVNEMTPLTSKRVMQSLKDVRIASVEDISMYQKKIIDAISFAISGTTPFAWIKRYHIRKRLLRRAKINEIFYAINCVLEIFPYADIFTSSASLDAFNNLMTQENEK